MPLPEPEPLPRSGTMHFSVDGDWLCSIVRDTILSDRWDSAVRILREVEGLSREQEEGIFRGELTLLSDLSDIVPLDEARKTAYQGSVAYLYAGRIRLPNKQGWWRPVAALTDVGPHDLSNRAAALADKWNGLDGEPASRWQHSMSPPMVDPEAGGMYWNMRAGHYAYNGEVPVVTRRAVFAAEGYPLSGIVYFEPCDALPSWSEPLRDPTAAVEQALAVGRPFEQRGHQWTYGTTPDPVRAKLYTYRTGDLATDAMIDAMPNAMAIDAITAHERGVESLVMQGKRRAQAAAVEEAVAQATDEQRERARRVTYHTLRQTILDRAGGRQAEWRRFTTEAGETYAVLRRPFDRYVLESRWKLEPERVEIDAIIQRSPWASVSPPGLKMGYDDPAHSDWVLTLERGSKGLGEQDARDGFYWSPVFADDPNRWYSLGPASEGTPEAALRFALYRLQNAVEDYYLRAGADPVDMKPEPVAETPRPIVLRLSDYINAPRAWSGSVLHPKPDEEVPMGSILVVPHLGPEFYIPAASAGAGGLVIAGAGGETAHLVQVGHDHPGGFPALVVYPGAVTAFPVGSQVDVDVKDGTVTITRRMS